MDMLDYRISSLDTTIRAAIEDSIREGCAVALDRTDQMELNRLHDALRTASEDYTYLETAVEYRGTDDDGDTWRVRVARFQGGRQEA